MNKQQRNGSRGIEWCDYTWNPVGGCAHDCQWQMPDGAVAVCYAKDVAEGVASSAYPQGFKYHYWNPNRLEEPLLVKRPHRIFLDSMSDLMGRWVPEWEVNVVLDVCRRAHWHTFQLLTKNAPRLRLFDFPDNVWVGVSSPPDWMFGKRIYQRVQKRMLHKSLKVLSEVGGVTWMSFEPLSWDVSDIVAQYAPYALNWAVIGAATNGKRAYQPDPSHVGALLDVLDHWKIPVFFKGNLEWEPWREEFPVILPERLTIAAGAGGEVVASPATSEIEHDANGF